MLLESRYKPGLGQFTVLLVVMSLLLGLPTSLAAQNISDIEIKVTRLLDQPIIGPDIHPGIGENMQGPSVIRVPDWVSNPLGRYYLYFADHKGL
jgi:hypothetical protein